MTGATIWLNGKLVSGNEPALMAGDRGFLLGDGAFETMRAIGSRIVWLDEHLARLRGAAGTLNIAVPASDSEIEAGLHELLAATGPGDHAVRLTLSRGVGSLRGLWPAGEATEPTLLATAAPLPMGRVGLRLIVAETTRRNEHSPLSRIKSLNYGDNLLARQEAERRGADDAIMLNTAGRVACATVASIFLRLGGRWVTPSLDQGILPGLARARLLKLLGAEERPVERADLVSVDEALLANSLGLGSVAEIEGRAVAPTDMERLAVVLYA